jgi:hypothetical protein
MKHAKKKQRKEKNRQENNKGKMAVFWYDATCSLVDISRRFRGASYLHYHDVSEKLTFCTIKVTMEAVSPLPHYAVQDIRKQPSSYSSP